MAAQHRTTAETEIRQLIDGFQQAIQAKDLNGVLSLYAPDIVSFDLVPPMQHVGIAAYRRPWEATFASFDGRIGYQVSDLHIITAAEVAFSHSLNQMSGTTTSGQTTSMWVRWTACFRAGPRARIAPCRIPTPPARAVHGKASGPAVRALAPPRRGTSACSGPASR